MIDLIHISRKAKAAEAKYRAVKRPVADRSRTSLIFIDFRKAFDRVNLIKLFKLMVKLKYDMNLIEALENMLRGKTLYLRNEVIEHNNGVP